MNWEEYKKEQAKRSKFQKWWDNVKWIPYRRWQWIKDRPRYTKYFFQRAKRGYADNDVWGLCDHICDIMVGGTKQLRKYNVGHPVGLSDKSWKQVLKDIEDGFKAGKRLSDGISYIPAKSKKLKGKAYIKEYNRRQKPDEKKFNKGMKLMHKYFFNLWD